MCSIEDIVSQDKAVRVTFVRDQRHTGLASPGLAWSHCGESGMLFSEAA